MNVSRSLREKWEMLGDTLSDSQRKLEVRSLQWSSYDDSFQQFQRWLSEAAAKVKHDSDVKATLQEKKVQQQDHKVGRVSECPRRSR